MRFYKADENGDFKSSGENPEDLMKREVLPKINKRQRVLYKRLVKGGENRRSSVMSQAELLELVNLYNIIASVIRKTFSRELRNNLQNEVAIYAGDTNADDFVMNYYTPDNLLKHYTNAHHITAEVSGIWGHFNFAVVEESGVMRIASFWIHDGKE